MLSVIIGRCKFHSGDLIFIPAASWHGVENRSLSVAVTANYLNFSNYLRVRKGVSSLLSWIDEMWRTQVVDNHELARASVAERRLSLERELEEFKTLHDIIHPSRGVPQVQAAEPLDELALGPRSFIQQQIAPSFHRQLPDDSTSETLEAPVIDQFGRFRRVWASGCRSVRGGSRAGVLGAHCVGVCSGSKALAARGAGRRCG